MQSPPTQETYTIRYQVPRNVLLRIWWKRMLMRRRMILLFGVLLFLSLSLLLAFPTERVLPIGAIGIGICLLAPLNLYRILAKAIDGNAQFTDPKTMEFSESKLNVTGPNWKSELPWTRFHGFSEDSNYFYLHLSDNGLDSVLPKGAFTPEQQQRFREIAQRYCRR